MNLEELHEQQQERHKARAPAPTFHAVYIDSLGERHEWQRGTDALEESIWRVEHASEGGGWEDYAKTIRTIRERFRPVQATIERIEWTAIGDQIVAVFEPRKVWVWSKGKGWLSTAEVQALIDDEDAPADHPGWIVGDL